MTDLAILVEHLLPTPTVVDMGANKTPDEWDQWTTAMRERHGNGNGHGPSLTQEALALLPTPHAGLGERGRDGVYPNPRGQQDLQHTIATDVLHMTKED